MASKKRKIDLENRQFNGEWTEDYLFVLNPSNKPKCLLCDCTLSMIKSQNIKRHFFTHHKHFNDKYKPGSWARKQKVACLDKSASSQKQCLSTFVSEQSKATEATLSISHILGKRMMTYSDAEAVKECIVEAVKIMHPSKKEVITSMTTLPLSRLTCTRRCTDIAEDLHDQVLIEVKDADCYALALDESTDITNCAQLAVFVRYFHHGVFNEELLALITLHGNTTAAAIYDALISKLKELQLPIQNICALSTDGAPAMIGACHGVVTNLRTEYCPDLIVIHCIIHQSVLCAKLSGDFQELMTDAMKLINKLKANSSLKHRQLRNFLDQHNAEFCDLLTHNNVRWLSKGNALKRLWDLRKDLVMFLNEKGQTSTLLEGTNLCNLAFLADCFTHLNTLNLKLQGKGHTIIQLWSAVKSFKQQLLLFVSDITKDMLHFPCLKVTIQEVSCDNDWSCFVEFLQNLDTEFCNRFKEFYEISSVIELISHPLSADVNGTWKTQLSTEYALLVSKMQVELCNLKGDEICIADPNVFWLSLVTLERYPVITRLARRILTCFASTYLCESLFSSMNFVKNKHRTRLTNAHLHELMRISVSDRKPRFDAIVRSKPTHHFSH
ncbi:general transcription factor II-I repeat domain-containing protein 2A-like [Clavelina lepadiformis]|uniref:general transcription factor II-I repeat domain-containing protein 2A-like n=1 Tax=Clavelina lepadiformis TaxID=159417 RepID=UPI004042F0C4